MLNQPYTQLDLMEAIITAIYVAALKRRHFAIQTQKMIRVFGER